MSKENKVFASLLDKRGHFYCPEGSRTEDIFEMRINERGHKVLEKVGEKDIYQDIQSYYEDTKIENIIAKCAAGDTSLLNQRTGVYADISNCPNDLMEAQNTIIKLGNEFEKLPAEIRAKFDNSKEKFVNEFGSSEFYEKIGIKTEEVQKTEEVTFDGKETTEPLTPEDNK